MSEFIDFLHQPIHIDSYVIVPGHRGRLLVCKVVRLNEKTIVVREAAYPSRKPFRVNAHDSILLSGEDLLALELRKGIIRK